MAAPLQLTADLFAPVPSSVPAQHVPPFPLLLSASFEHEHRDRLLFTGSSGRSISLGTMAPGGADFKLLVIYQEYTDIAEAITVTLNEASAGAFTIAPGGFIIVANPVAQTTPDIGVIWTADAVVRVYAYG
jgi:hypothetical protein